MTMRKRGWRRRALAWVVGVALVWGAGLAGAQGTPPAYDGLDILFIVDQSGSMGGEDFGEPERVATDPLGLRFEAVQYAYNVLGEYRLNFMPNTPTHFAVISFGDEARVTLDWTPVADTPADWPTTSAAIQQQLSVDTFRVENPELNLGNTNFIAAYEAARDLFAARPANSNTLRVVILLTDGQPCVGLGPNAFACDNTAAQQRHMEDLLTLTEAAFPPGTYALYVIALDDTGQIWDTRRTDWEAVVRDPANATRAETSQQIGVRFLDILTQVANRLGGQGAAPVPIPVGTSEIPIPPYQREVQLSIFKSTTTPAQLDVTRPDGTALAPTDPALSVRGANNPIEVWTIQNPAPGTWTFTLPADVGGINASLQLIPITLQAEIPAQTYFIYDTVTVTVALQQENGTPLPIYPDTPLNVEARITGPDGLTETVPLALVTGSTFSADVVPGQAGTYTVGVGAATQFPPGTRYPLLDAADVGTFTVTALDLVLLTQPEPSYLVGNTFTIEAAVRDSAGAPVAVPAGTTVTAELVGAAGTVPLPLETTAPGQYSAALTLDTPDTYRVRVAATGANGAAVDETLSDPFTVEASIPVGLFALAPAPGSVHYTREGSPPFFPQRPMNVSFNAATVADGQAIALEGIAADFTDPFTVTVTRNGDPVPGDFPVTPTDADGTYTVALGALPPGDYAVSVAFAAPLTDRYLLADPPATVSFAFQRAFNPVLYAYMGGAGLLALVVVGGGAFAVTRDRATRQHPLRGAVTVLNEQMAEVTTLALGGKRNQLVFSRKQLGVSSASSIKRVTLASTAQSAQMGMINARVEGKGDVVRRPLSLYDGGPEQISGLANFGGEGETEPIYYLRYEAPPDEGGFGGLSADSSYL